MASIVSDSGNRKRIQFTAGDGRRKTLRLGVATMRQAEAVKGRVEQLVLSATGASGVVDTDTVDWLGKLDDGFYGKLAAVGLVSPRQQQAVRLGQFLDNYIASRQDVKPATILVYDHTRRKLLDFFGPDKPLRDITSGDGDQWRLSLIEQGLASNTVARRSGIAKQFFRAAQRRRLTSENPFQDLRANVQGNPQRYYFVTPAESQTILDACPDAEWRLIFSLSRYGGLRCPSEIMRLTWQDIDWERQRMLVHSCKTEHHEGGDSRYLPVFPELLPHLQEAFEQAEPGTEYVITRYRQSNVNLRTQLLRIIHKAGLKSWPKLFQNLRSSRQTELCEHWPEHVVCSWLGNSRAIARRHYLQVTDEHFERAVRADTVTFQATQIPTQQDAELSRTASHHVSEYAKCDSERDNAILCDVPVGGIGLEPMTSCV